MQQMCKDKKLEECRNTLKDKDFEIELSESEQLKVDNIDYNNFINVGEVFMICYFKLVSCYKKDIKNYLDLLKHLEKLNVLISKYKKSYIGKGSFLSEIEKLIQNNMKDVLFVIKLCNPTMVI